MLLYIHIPFCDSKCHYCAFNSYTAHKELKSAYMNALLTQLKHELQNHAIPPHGIETLYIGGGTPSTIAAEAYTPLFEQLASYLHPEAEITAEANPNSATPEWLTGMRALGVNRLSLGVQSFDDAKLRLLGRAHSADQAKKAVAAAHEAGFARLSIDLMYSTPFDTPEFIEGEMARIKELPIDHLSLYSLTIEEQTPFAERPEVQQEREEVYDLIRHHCNALGLDQYEVANFGNPSRHNAGYWAYKPYLGIGAGAVGRTGSVRTYPHKNLNDYIAQPLYAYEENLTPDDIKTEKVLLGLRYVGGFDYKLLSEDERKRLHILEKNGTLWLDKGRVYSTNLFLGDEIALYLLD